MPAPAPAPTLTTQVVGPLFTLAAAGPGEHVLTINVTPDNLGPVTVRAHVSGEGIRVELFVPTDAARESLRAILPDLRRDLAGSGMNSSLDLSSGNQPADDNGSRRDPSALDQRNSADGNSAARTVTDPAPARNAFPRTGDGASTIDVFA